MRKSTFLRPIVAAIVAVLFFGATVHAQLNNTTVTMSGTPIAGSPFSSLAAAITAVNGLTITGPVIVTAPTGTETAPTGGFSITATGTVTNTINIQGNGSSNTVITAANPAGTSGALTDAIFKIIGGDYITIQGFAMNENGSNAITTAGTNNMVEWGVALLYATTTNGAQNCTIQNNSITLNRTYQNTFGIYSNSTHSATTISSATATTTAGGNSGLKIYSNTISNVNNGIVIVGPTAAADANTGVEVGGSMLGNTISNFGGTGTFSSYNAVSGSNNGILIRNSNGTSIISNSITSSAGGVTSGSLFGIHIPAASATPTTTFTNNINGNTISLQSGLIAGLITGINYPSGSASATSVVNINSNNFTQLNHSVSGTAAIVGISLASTNLTTSISSNTFTNISTNTTGNFTFIFHSFTMPASGSTTINNNSIVTGFNKTGAGGTVVLTTTSTSSPSSAALTQTGNNFSNITVTGATTLTGFTNTDGAASSCSKTITGNTFNNWTGGTSAINTMNYTYWGGGTTNTISNNTITNITNQGTLTGITLGSAFGGSNPLTVTNNTITGLSSTGTGGNVTGITTSNTTSAINIFNNKIANLSTTAATSLVSGLTIGGSGTNLNVYNNLIGNLTAASGNNGATDVVRGISITSAAASSSINLFYNTIYLAGTSSAADFASSGIFHTFNTTGTTAALLLKNNIIVNACTAKGLGRTSALRRSAATDLNNFSTSSSNNLYFGSTIYFDGTNSDVTINAYTTRVGARATASFVENPTWISTTSSSSDFLHIDATVPTQIESGGTPISSPISITDDFDGNVRHLTTPDVGADEGSFTIAVPMSYTSSTTEQVTGFAYAGAINQSIIRVRVVTTGATTPLTLTSLTLNANGTTAIGDINATTAKVYYTGSSTTFSTSSQFGATTPTIADFVVTGSQALVEGNNYFWLAYDVIGAATSGNAIDGECIDITVGAVQTPTVSAPASNKTILGTMTGTYAVGASQVENGTAFTNLTNAITDLTARGVSGAVTFALQNDYSSSGETFPLTINAVTGASGSNTITIKPASGVTATISGSSSSSIFKLNGADYVTIDGSNSGGTDRSLTISNTSTGTNTAAIWISSLGAGLGATDNSIKNCNIKAGSNTVTSTMGIAIGGTSLTPTNTGADNNNITIQNNAISKATYGITANGVITTGELTGLLITQNTIGSSTAADYITGYGTYMTNANAPVISRNEVYNMIYDGSKYGIWFGTTVHDAVLSRNNIHAMGQTNTTSTYYCIGIYFSSSTGCSNNQLDNNIIYDLDQYGSTSNFYYSGIRIVGGTTYKLYHNTISLSGAFGSSTSGVFANCLFVSSASTNMDIRNNIFLNTRTGTSPKSYTINTVSSTTYTNINNNNYFSSGAAIGLVGGVEVVNLTALQGATTQDAASIDVNPLLNSTTNMIPGLSSPVIGAGVNGTGITVDYAGTVRGNPPYIGAYEAATDLAGPTISFTALGNTASLTNRTTTSFATITDPSNINTSGGTKPRLYYKKSTSNNAFVGNTSGDNGWKYVEADNATSPFDFTIDYSILMGGSVAVSDVIQYFVVAADLAGSPNVRISNSLSFVGATPTSVDLQGQGVTSITGTLSSYSVLASFTGTITVPGSYPSLTLAGGAFEAINNGIVTGNLNIEIAGDLTSETGLNALNQFATPHTIKIYPTGSARVVSGSLNSNALIKLNGADNVTIDGSIGGVGTDKSLTITNTATTAPTAIALVSLGTGLGATNNSIKNCNISTGVANSTGYGISIGGSTPGTSGADNDNVTVQNNTITVATVGIYAIGTASNSTGGNDNLTITGNSVDYNGALTSIGIRVGNGLNGSISSNTLSIESNAASALVGISLETGFVSSTISNNLLTKVLSTDTGGEGGRGITIGTATASSNLTISNNVIYNVNGSNWTGFNNSSSMGIAIGMIGTSTTVTTTAGGINLYNNSVNMYGNYDYNGSSVTAAIYVGSNASALNIRNNIFSNSMNNTNVGGTGSKNFAIYSAAANTAFTTINYNNYFVSGTQGVLGFLSSDRTNLAGIVTGFGGNANSYNANPNFTSNTNLLPVANAFPSNYRLGTNIGGLTTDYSGTTRSNPPDVGAYEGVDANRWIGTISTAWATNTNWDNGSVPASNENITIAANNLNNPVLGGDITVNGISIDGTSTVGIGSNTLTVNGAVSGTGTVSGSATSNLTIGGTAGTVNFTSGARIVKNLTLNASATATLGTALDIVAGSAFGTLTVGAGGTLTTGGTLTIKSDANGTAQVANSAGSVSGNVTVERYIPAKRAWRLLTAPLGGSNTSVNTAWQNGGSVVANTGVEIWHPSGGTGVTTAGNAANLKTFDVVNNAWVPVTNTQTTNLFTNAGSAANNAFLIFPTGPYNGTGAGNDQSTPAAITTLRATGALQTGTQTFSIPDAAFSNSEKIQLIGNPYASPVNFNLLTRTNVTKRFWAWDPQLSGVGGYVLVSDLDDDNTYTVTPGGSTQTQHIQSGQAFFVEVNNTGASLVFNEDDKSTSNINTVFRTGTGTERLSIDMINPNDGLVIDGILAEYNNNFSNGIAAEDGQKLFRSGENFYLTRNTEPLMLEGRKLIDNNDTLFLTLSGMQQQAYRFAINGSNFANDANLSAYLKDKFLSTETAISLSGATEYNFTVTADNNSKAADRFMIVFRSNASLPVTLTNVKAYQQNSGINVEWNTQSESGMQQYEVEKSANGNNFVKVNTTAAKSGTTNSYNWFDATPFSGANYYRIKAISLNGEVKYSSIVVVRLNAKGTKVTLYPNPVKGGTIQLQLSNLEKGNYSVTLFNQLGQQVMSKTINHNGGSSNQTIEIGTIAGGVYELRLSNGQTVITQKLIKE